MRKRREKGGEVAPERKAEQVMPATKRGLLQSDMTGWRCVYCKLVRLLSMGGRNGSSYTVQ